MRMLIAADWLPTFGGAERVVAALHRTWPDAPIVTTVARRERLAELATADIRVSRLQRPFRLLRAHSILLPWMPRAMERFDTRGYDIILSSSHAVGKGIVPASSARHICYCHTPMRYAWEMEQQYLDDFRVPSFLRARIRRELARLRRWDLTTAQRVDRFIANSSTTQERIRRIYGRDSTVVHPPVADRFFAGALRPRLPAPDAPLLAVGRMVPYKRFDVLIAAANTLRCPLWIAGTGSEARRLAAMAGPTVRFLGRVSDADLPGLYAGASAVLFPQIEDAGVVPLEAQACGTPVIALGHGGVLDTVRDGETGMFFAEQTLEALLAALESFDATRFDPAALRTHALQFSEKTFRTRMAAIVEEEYALLRA